jgi:Cdc6-like AAA superfamily ATPase
MLTILSTGKTTVARLFAQCLASMGVVPGTEFKELTAARLMNGGTRFCEQIIQEVLNAGGGAIFIDEAYQLASGSSPGGRQVLDFLLPEVENHTGKILFILAGYDKEMEDLFAHNEGFRSRFPHELRFMDYEDHELRKILEHQVRARYKNSSVPMELEDGMDGLYVRIVARRIGYGRGRPGFGNARAVANQVAIIFERQANRLKAERRAGQKPNDFFISKKDLIGPEPSVALSSNKSWQTLCDLTGLKTVKDSVRALLQTLQTNYDNELQERPLISFNLNKVFVGSPGTGKTTVAKLYGQILADIGFLTNGEVVVKDPSDFVGGVIGESEKLTMGILAATAGKVLVIDECYGLCSGASTSASSQNDPYRTAVIDTLVAGVQSVPGEDRCVLLLGYKNEMERMFQSVNPGLSRRFPMSEAFVFEDFSDAELQTILRSKLKQAGFGATQSAFTAAMESLQRARNKPNFGNAGEVDILLNGAKTRHQQRNMRSADAISMVFEPFDIDPEHDRITKALVNVQDLFKDDIGRDDVVKEMEAMQKAVRISKARGKDPRDVVPFNFVFSGPPGEFRTTLFCSIDYTNLALG